MNQQIRVTNQALKIGNSAPVHALNISLGIFGILIGLGYLIYFYESSGDLYTSLFFGGPIELPLGPYYRVPIYPISSIMLGIYLIFLDRKFAWRALPLMFMSMGVFDIVWQDNLDRLLSLNIWFLFQFSLMSGGYVTAGLPSFRLGNRYFWFLVLVLTSVNQTTYYHFYEFALFLYIYKSTHARDFGTLKEAVRTAGFRFRVLRRHPSLIVQLGNGEVIVSKMHIGKELESARSRFLACQRNNYTLEQTVREFQKRICHQNAFLYAVCKVLKPKIVVETGVRRGESSAFILQAMQENKIGRLYSIDLPNTNMGQNDQGNSLPMGGATGYLVTPELNVRWELIIGDSRTALPKLLKRLYPIQIDLFHHDSLHTYEHMTSEFNEAWDRMDPSGVLMSGDLHYNEAFFDFCRSKGIEPVVIKAVKSTYDTGFAWKKG